MTGRAWRPPDGGPVRWRRVPGVPGWVGYLPSRRYRTWGGGRAYGYTPGVYGQTGTGGGPTGGRRHRPGPGARRWTVRAHPLPGVGWEARWVAELRVREDARAYRRAMARCAGTWPRCPECGEEQSAAGCACIPF